MRDSSIDSSKSQKPSRKESSAWHKGLTATAAIYIALLGLPGCCLIPNLRQAEPGPILPSTYPEKFPGAQSTDNSSDLNVEDFYNDPVLSNLIQQALVGNQELRILAQNVEIANNEILARKGAYLPFVNFGGGAGLLRPSKFTPEGAVEDGVQFAPGQNFPNPLPDFMMAANLSWQLDIWRQLRNARDAAALRYLATSEGRNYVVTRVVAEVAENYFGLLALDKRIEVLDQTIQLQEQSLEVAKAKKAAGQGNELAVQRFQAEVRKNQSEKLIVRQEIIEVENRINFLLGRYPQPVERPTVDFIDLQINTLSVGVPAQLLRNRPDVRRAERELQAAGVDIAVARADFFPKVFITGGVGYEAFNTRYLFQPDAFVGRIAGDLVAPVVNLKAIKAQYRTANARQLQAIYEYQRTVLNAFTEVVNRVSKVQNYAQSIEVKKQQLESLRLSVESASSLFQSAQAEYIDVLFAQRDYLDARTIVINTKREQLSAIVNAYQALGGGDVLFSSAQNPQRIHHWPNPPIPDTVGANCSASAPLNALATEEQDKAAKETGEVSVPSDGSAVPPTTPSAAPAPLPEPPAQPANEPSKEENKPGAGESGEELVPSHSTDQKVSLPAPVLEPLPVSVEQ
ncbi:TolC family protein [bacterium]|nr:TolC family protein [bacterium]